MAKPVKRITLTTDVLVSTSPSRTLAMGKKKTKASGKKTRSLDTTYSRTRTI